MIYSSLVIFHGFSTNLIEIEIEFIENSSRRQRVFGHRLNPMDAYSDFDFIAKLQNNEVYVCRPFEQNFNQTKSIYCPFPSNCSNNTTSCSYTIPSYRNVSDCYRIRTWNLANICTEMRNCCD